MNNKLSACMTTPATWLQRLSSCIPRSTHAVVAGGLAALVLGGCASLGLGGTPEEVVQRRATERWGVIVSKGVGAVYGYTTPGYRAITTIETHRKRFGTAVSYISGEAVNVRCPETTKCIAMVRIEAKPFLGRKFGDNIVTHVEETWLLEDGQWWLFEKL